MVGRPQPNEAAPYYFKYIDQAQGDDIVGALETQLDEIRSFLAGIGEEKSLHRYAPEKWSIRQVLNHVTDTERVFLFRAFWFARGFDSPLPVSSLRTPAPRGRRPSPQPFPGSCGSALGA